MWWGNFSKVNYISIKTIRWLSVFCEKVLTQGSRQQSVTKYNFYQMFYDQVLTKKAVAYAVVKKQGKDLKYLYVAKVNWKQEFDEWIALRGQNSLNDISNALGLDV